MIILWIVFALLVIYLLYSFFKHPSYKNLKHEIEKWFGQTPQQQAKEWVEEDEEKEKEKEKEEKEKEKETSNNESRVPMPDDATSSIQKAGWCFVGEEKGIRTCARVNETDKCMSGNIFPSRDVCVNPSLRK
jgi:hypothetical protein